MDIENTNQTKLPVQARIGGGKLIVRGKTIVRRNLIVRGKTIIRERRTLPKDARTKLPRGNVIQVTKQQGKIIRTVETGKGQVQRRNLVAKDGKILRIKRNFTSSGKKLDSSRGMKVLQTKTFRNKSITQTVKPQNSNPSGRMVEFDDQDDVLEVENGQDDFMGKVNVSFPNVSNFPKVQSLLPTPAALFPTPPLFPNPPLIQAPAVFPTPSLLPTPPLLPAPVEERVFPPVHRNFDNYSRNLDAPVDNFRDMQRIKEDYENELRLERERVEDLMHKEEQRRFKEEQRKIDDERRYIDNLRKTLDKEKRDLEILKKTVEQQEEIDKRNRSKGREMGTEFVDVYDRDTNKIDLNTLINASQNQKLKNNSKQFTNRIPASEFSNYNAKQNKNEGRGRFDSRVENRKRNEKKNPAPAPQSNRMPASGLLDFMLKINSASRERAEYSSNREREYSNNRGEFNDRGGNKNNKMNFDQSSRFNDTRRDYNRDSDPQSNRMGATLGLMDYLVNENFTDNQRSNRESDFNQSNRYYQKEGLLRTPDYQNYPGSNNYSQFSQVGSSRENEMFSNQNRNYEMNSNQNCDYEMNRNQNRDYEMNRNQNHDYEMNRNQNHDYEMNRNQNHDYEMNRNQNHDYEMNRNQNRNYEMNRNQNRNYEMNSNQNRNYEINPNQNRNYNDLTEYGHQDLSRGFKPVKEDTSYNQGTNNLTHQKSIVGHPYYDNMYDQGRLGRDFSKNSGRLGSSGNQETWKSSPYSSGSQQNTSGFTGYSFKNRSPIYKGPQQSERNYNSNQSFAGSSNQTTSQGQKPTESFYSYRPGEKQTNDTSKSGHSGGGIDILGGSTSLMGDLFGNSSSNYKQNQPSSLGNSSYGNEARNNNMGSFSNKGQSKNTMMDAGNNSPDNPEKKIKKKLKNLQRELRNLYPGQTQKKERLESRIAELNDELSKLRFQWRN